MSFSIAQHLGVFQHFKLWHWQVVCNTDKWHVVGGTEVSLQRQRKPLFFGKNPCNVQQLIAGQKQLKGVFDKTLHFKVLGEDRVKSLFSSKSMVS